MHQLGHVTSVEANDDHLIVVDMTGLSHVGSSGFAPSPGAEDQLYAASLHLRVEDARALRDELTHLLKEHGVGHA